MAQRRRSRVPTARQAQKKRKSRLPTQAEKDAKAQYEQLRRRSWCLVRKSHELKKLCKVKVFMLVQDDARGRSQLFSSEQLSSSWPPSVPKLVSIFLKPLKAELTMMQMTDPSVRRIIEDDYAQPGRRPTWRNGRRRSSDFARSESPARITEFKSLCAEFENTGSRKFILLQLLGNIFDT